MFLVPWFTSDQPLSKISPKDWKKIELMVVFNKMKIVMSLAQYPGSDDEGLGDDYDDQNLSKNVECDDASDLDEQGKDNESQEQPWVGIWTGH